MRFATAAKVLRPLMLIVALVAFVKPAIAATLFSENFSDFSPNPNMALGTGSGSPATDFTGGNFTITSGTGSRIYLGTNDTDYNSMEFIFEATVTMTSDTSPWGYFFMGLGNRDATGGSGEPGNPNLLAAIDPNGFFRPRDNGVDPGSITQTTTNPTSGTHRMRMSWTASTQKGLFQLDLNYTGTFVSNYSFILDGATNGFTSSNSRLIVGGGNHIVIDDITVIRVPEPAGDVLWIIGAILPYVTRTRLRRRSQLSG